MKIYLQKQNNYAFDIVPSLRFEVKDYKQITYLSNRNLNGFIPAESPDGLHTRAPATGAGDARRTGPALSRRVS